MLLQKNSPFSPCVQATENLFALDVKPFSLRKKVFQNFVHLEKAKLTRFFLKVLNYSKGGGLTESPSLLSMSFSKFRDKFYSINLMRVLCFDIRHEGKQKSTPIIRDTFLNLLYHAHFCDF